jgi:NADH pyrophosphatase NudC (nudix superfamily)
MEAETPISCTLVRSDRVISRKIRKAIHEDQSLTTYAHNIKVISWMTKLRFAGQCGLKTVQVIRFPGARATLSAG